MANRKRAQLIRLVLVCVALAPAWWLFSVSPRIVSSAASSSPLENDASRPTSAITIDSADAAETKDDDQEDSPPINTQIQILDVFGQPAVDCPFILAMQPLASPVRTQDVESSARDWVPGSLNGFVDQEGRLNEVLPPGNGVLMVDCRSRGFGRFQFQVPGSAHFQLEASAVIAAHVRREDGTPVPHALVTIDSSTWSEAWVDDFLTNLRRELVAVSQYHIQIQRFTRMTDAQGNVEFALPPGRGIIRARWQQGDSRGLKDAEVGEAVSYLRAEPSPPDGPMDDVTRAWRDVDWATQRLQHVDLILPTGIELKGLVLDAEGLPTVARVHLKQDADDPNDEDRFASVVTDATGAFSIRGLNSRLVALTAWVNKPEQRAHARVSPDQALVIRLLRPQVKGRVVDDQGAALKSFTLDGQHRLAEDGRFVRELGDEDELSLTIGAPGFTSRTLVARQTGDLGDVRLEKGRRLSGVILDAQTQAAVASAQVRAGLASAVSDGSGHFEISDAPLMGVVRVDAVNFVPVELRREENESPMRVLLNRGASLVVRVEDAEGLAWAGSRLRIFGPTGGIQSPPTDDRGQVQVWGLREGAWVVQSPVAQFDPVQVQVGKTGTYLAVLRPSTGGVEVRLEWEPAAPLRHPEVSLLPPRYPMPDSMSAWHDIAHQLNRVADEGGVFHRVEPGEHTLFAFRTVDGQVVGLRKEVVVTGESPQVLRISNPEPWQSLSFLAPRY
jgi:hypothetical protein